MTDNPMLALAHTMVSSPGVLALLLGSGVSRASGIPTGWEITLGLVRDLAVLQGEDAGADPAAWYEAATGQQPDYSALLEQLARATGERRNLLERFFEPTAEEREEGLKRPTEAHRVVARLMARGYVRVVLTTNFDRLLEDACAEEGVAPVVISTNDNASSAEPLVHQRHVVIKLHGDYKDPRIMNTTTELATYPPEMDKLLDQVLGEYGLVVCGWSGDWDAALRAGFKRVRRLRYSAFWAALSPPSGRGAEVALGRRAAIITIKDADVFFRELEEKALSLEDLRAQRPSSPAIAVATLKRYIAEDRYLVRLGDLIREEAVEVARKVTSITSDTLRIGTSPASALVNIDRILEVMRALCFHGCRLCRTPAQQEAILSGILMLGPTEAPQLHVINTHGQATLQDLKPYPCASVLTAAAYGAVVASNWSLLRRILTSTLVLEGERMNVCSAITSWRLLKKGTLKQAPSMQETEHVRKIMVELAEGYVPSPTDVYHRLEVWARLAVFENQPDPHRGGQVAAGCYLLAQRNPLWQQPRILFEEADAASAAWPPFEAGWFDGSPLVFTRVRSAYTAWSERTNVTLEAQGII